MRELLGWKNAYQQSRLWPDVAETGESKDQTPDSSDTRAGSRLSSVRQNTHVVWIAVAMLAAEKSTLRGMVSTIAQQFF